MQEESELTFELLEKALNAFCVKVGYTLLKAQISRNSPISVYLLHFQECE